MTLAPLRRMMAFDGRAGCWCWKLRWGRVVGDVDQGGRLASLSPAGAKRLMATMAMRWEPCWTRSDRMGGQGGL